MNRLSKTILPLALGLGLAAVMELPASAFPRKSSHQSRSRVIIVSPSRDRYRDDYSYDGDYRNVDYDRRDRYDDSSRDINYGRRRRRRSSRYDCGPRNRRVGRRRRDRRYYSGQRNSPRIYRDSPNNSRSVRVIRY